MIKAVFFDLDGTLVSYETHTMPTSTRLALQLLQDRGIKVFISTGRHKATIDNIGDWTPDGYVVLNGGMCIVDGKILFERHIDKEDIQALLEYMRTKGEFPCVFLLEKDLILNFQNEQSDEVFQFLNFPMPIIDSLEEAAQEPVYELMIMNSQAEENRMMLYLPNCEATRSHELYADVIPKGSNKWVGITKMLEYFDLKPEEVMAFGDGNNDLEMITNAGIGVAMGNGSDRLKKVADYVTSTVDKDGIWNALKKYDLI